MENTLFFWRSFQRFQHEYQQCFIHSRSFQRPGVKTSAYRRACPRKPPYAIILKRKLGVRLKKCAYEGGLFMREDLCTIPINEVFEPRDGCPFCRMRDMLEDRMATYITGAAMMEPDVRIETNRLGF